jgi:hypothetical protein
MMEKCEGLNHDHAVIPAESCLKDTSAAATREYRLRFFGGEDLAASPGVAASLWLLVRWGTLVNISDHPTHGGSMEISVHLEGDKLYKTAASGRRCPSTSARYYPGSQPRLAGHRQDEESRKSRLNRRLFLSRFFPFRN